MATTLDAVMAALRTVKDPEKGRDILSAGMGQDLTIAGDTVRLRVTVKTPVRNIRDSLETQVREALVTRAGAGQVDLKMEVDAGKARKTEIHMQRKHLEAPLERIRHTHLRVQLRSARQGHNGAIKIVRIPFALGASMEPVEHGQGVFP